MNERSIREDMRREELRTPCYVVQEDGTLVRKNVETGLSADDYTEIKSGLEFGDRVVSGGITAGIQEGTRVTPVEG